MQKIKDFFKNNWAVIKAAFFGAIGGAIVCYCVLIFGPKNPTVYTNWEQQYKTTQHQLDSANTVSVDLRKQIDSLQKRDPIIVKQEQQLDKKIPIINKQKDEKISVIDSYNVDSLQRFFAERYDTSGK